MTKIKKIVLLGPLVILLVGVLCLVYSGHKEKSVLVEYIASGPFADKLDQVKYGQSDCYFADQPNTTSCGFIALDISKEECEVVLAKPGCYVDPVEKAFHGRVVVEVVHATEIADIFEYRVLLKPKL